MRFTCVKGNRSVVACCDRIAAGCIHTVSLLAAEMLQPLMGKNQHDQGHGGMQAGHAVHEDEADKTADVVAKFLQRFKIGQPLPAGIQSRR